MKALALVVMLLVSGPIVSAQPVVVIVRHAEKAANGGNDPDLSSAGHARAEALARILKDSGITAIFTSEFKRTQETANALVIGHDDTIPNIVNALGINSSINIPDADYSELLIVILGDKPQLFRLHYPDDEQSR